MAYFLTHVGILVIGCNDRSALIYSKEKENYEKQMMPVEDVSFDPLSYKYVLVAYKDGAMVLYDFEGPHVFTQFERQGAGIKCIPWNKLSGEFFISSDEVAALRILSVSKNAPVDILKLGNSGVYCIDNKKPEFCTEPGHAETVFDLQINSRDKNMLATASYETMGNTHHEKHRNLRI